MFEKAIRVLGIKAVNSGRWFKVKAIQQAYKGKLILCKVDYGESDCLMYVDPKDEGLSIDLYSYGIKEPKPTKEFAKRLKPGMVVVDVGANIGYYAILESRIVERVDAIEPVQENLNLLEKNLKVNSCSNVFMFRLALGEKNGPSEISIPNRRNQSSFTPTGKFCKVKTQKVLMATMDRFLQGDKPDFIRMDVEGYEYEIVKGMKETLKDFPQLFIEVHKGRMGLKKTKKFLTLLKGYGNCRVISELTTKYSFFRPLLNFYSKKWDFVLDCDIDGIINNLANYPDKFHVFLCR